MKTQHEALLKTLSEEALHEIVLKKNLLYKEDVIHLAKIELERRENLAAQVDFTEQGLNKKTDQELRAYYDQQYELFNADHLNLIEKKLENRGLLRLEDKHKRLEAVADQYKTLRTLGNIARIAGALLIFLGTTWCIFTLVSGYPESSLGAFIYGVLPGFQLFAFSMVLKLLFNIFENKIPQ